VSSLSVTDSATWPSSSVGELSMPLDPRKIHFRGLNRDVSGDDNDLGDQLASQARTGVRLMISDLPRRQAANDGHVQHPSSKRMNGPDPLLTRQLPPKGSRNLIKCMKDESNLEQRQPINTR